MSVTVVLDDRRPQILFTQVCGDDGRRLPLGRFFLVAPGSDLVSLLGPLFVRLAWRNR